MKTKEPQYKDSGMTDINGKPILEGSIINADGYDSDLSNPDDIYVHAVEFYKGVFGSCIYSDFEPLSSYKKIEVIGHVKDYLHRLTPANECEEGFEWSGNLGACIKHPQENEIESSETEVLDINDIKHSPYFKAQMLKAYKHGIEFEPLECDGDMDITNTKDENLSFYEWFAKYYK